MLLILAVCYFVGRYFYQLAFEYHKHEWGFAILGCVTFFASYYGGAFLFGLLIAIMEWYSILEMNEFILGLMMLPLGFLGSGILYLLLKRAWKKQEEAKNDTLLDSNKDKF